MQWYKETEDQRELRRANWHVWFARYPVRLNDVKTKKVWLENIERSVLTYKYSYSTRIEIYRRQINSSYTNSSVIGKIAQVTVTIAEKGE